MKVTRSPSDVIHDKCIHQNIRIYASKMKTMAIRHLVSLSSCFLASQASTSGPRQLTQGCRKVVKSGGREHFGLRFISCSLHLLGGLGACPLEKIVL